MACLLLVFLPVAAVAQRSSFKLYGRSNGLANLSVLCLLQDSTGYLWIGTQHGLFRYDGAHFIGFDLDSGLPSARIESLHETPDRTLWAGTSAGLARREGARFVAVNVGTPVDITGRSEITSDPSNTLYVATSVGLLIGKREGAAYSFHRAPAPAGGEGRVHGLHYAPDGILWFGCGRGICRMESGRVVALQEAAGVPEDRWDAILTDRDGTLWARSSTRLLKRPRGAARFEPDELDIPDNSDFAALSLGSGGELFVPTDLGFMIRAHGSWRQIAKAQGLPSNSTSSVLMDREGSIWVGLLGLGVTRSLGFEQWENWTSAEGLSSDTIWGMKRDLAGDLWVGTDYGLNRLHISSDGHATWRAWTERDGLNGNKVRYVATAKDGVIWTGSSPGGVTRLDPKTGAIARYGLREGLTNDRITALRLDGRGGIWVATRGGLFHGAQRGRTMHFDPAQLQAADGNEIFYDALNDSHGHSWIGGSRGMLRMEKGHWRRFTTKDGLATNSVAYITQAKDGALWIGYREPYGVSRVVDDGDKLQIRTFTKKDGLSSDKPLFVGVDRRGWIWYGSDSGVDYYDGTRWRHYGQQDGLIWDDCDGNSFLADADGSVWIGTSGGLSHFHPTGGFNQEIVPSVEITRAQVGDRTTSDSRAIVVPPGHAPLFVFFSGLTFTHEDDVQFRYSLLGFEKDWVETPLRQLQYSNLPPGSYTLEVTARGAQGDWNRDAARASVVVLPAWWETWWARLASLILVLLTVWQSVRYREGRYRREQQRLASAVDQRTRELRVQTERIERKNAEIELLLKDAQEASQLKSEFLANVSHEIRTPMNGVLGMTALTLGTQLNGEQREYMEAAQQSATSLLSLLNEILDFSKIDAGHLELESVAFSPAECVREAIQTLAGTAQQKGLELQHTIADGVPKTVQGDPMRLRQVLLNLIGNAVKFTDQGSIQVKLAVDRFGADELLLQFSVKDTGVGIPVEKQRFIFEPFRQADGSTTRKHGGTGLGLAICARLVEMMGGRIWVESEPGVGSSFFFTGLFRLSEPGVEVKPKVSSTWNGNGLSNSNGHSGLHVLVAEDNSVNQRVVTRFLEKKGNRVTIANNGREAVEALDKHSFDLVLMDVQMPEMDGLEATTILRAREQANGGHLPVLALTAYAMKGDQDRCMRAGMDGYVSKPVRPEELFAAIEQVLAAKQST